MSTSDATQRGSAHDLELIQGSWRSIAMVVDGRKIPASAIEHRRIIIIDDKYVVVDGNRTLRRGTLRIDATKTPKHIDALPADGPNVGKIDQGIYELATDLLHLCWAPPGAPRPMDFKCEPGSKQWMATDQKETAATDAQHTRVVAACSQSPSVPGVFLTRVHHRDFPQVHGEGQTPYEAALVLLQHLITETGTTIDVWHREALDRVIGEVRAFIDRVM
jgi:uncharacterized protein (TIGR03067 family)